MKNRIPEAKMSVDEFNYVLAATEENVHCSESAHQNLSKRKCREEK